MIPFDQVRKVGRGEDKVVTVYDENANRLAQGSSLRKSGDTLFVDGRFAVPRRKVAYVTVVDRVPLAGEKAAKEVAAGVSEGVALMGVMIVLGVGYAFYSLARE